MEKPTARGAAASATARVAVSATARWSRWRLKSRRGDKGKGVGREEGEWISGRVCEFLPFFTGIKLHPFNPFLTHLVIELPSRKPTKHTLYL